jgi:hypothetical protein
MKKFQCSKRHRWETGESSHCPDCFRPSDDVVEKSGEMCPSCARRGSLWSGVSGLSYCDECGFEWDTAMKKIDILQGILDFKKNRRAL